MNEFYNGGSLIPDDTFEKMFSILRDNYKFLYEIKDDDYNVWKYDIKLNNKINTYILKDDNEISGYLQFVINDNDICISEVQVKEEYKGDKKTFNKLMKEFINLSEVEPDTIIYLHINPNNIKSKEVFTHIGFVNTSGNRYEIKGNILINKYL